MASIDNDDLAFWAYLDRLHSWTMHYFNQLWAEVNSKDFTGSYGTVYRAFVDLHYRSVAAALFASDDYIQLKAGAAGWWVDPSWREGRDWWARPWQLRGAVSAEEVLSHVPWAMKGMIAAGQGPKRALAVGGARVGRILGTDPAASARNYTRDFVAEEGGPRVKQLNGTEKAKRLDRITQTPSGKSVLVEPPPTEQPTSRVRQGLELPNVGYMDGPFQLWRRVPLPGACDFCLMLATRGAVYTSKGAAKYTADGRKYHDFCRCRVQLVTVPWQQDEVIVDPSDAKRKIKFKAQTGDTYRYDLGDFNVKPPEPEWL